MKFKQIESVCLQIDDAMRAHFDGEQSEEKEEKLPEGWDMQVCEQFVAYARLRNGGSFFVLLCLQHSEDGRLGEWPNHEWHPRCLASHCLKKLLRWRRTDECSSLIIQRKQPRGTIPGQVHCSSLGITNDFW